MLPLCILMYLVQLLGSVLDKGKQDKIVLTYVDCMSVQHYHRHHHEVLCQGFIINCGEKLSPTTASSMFSSYLQYLTKFTALEGPFDLGCSTPARQDQDRIRRGSVLRFEDEILRKHVSRFEVQEITAWWDLNSEATWEGPLLKARTTIPSQRHANDGFS